MDLQAVGPKKVIKFFSMFTAIKTILSTFNNIFRYGVPSYIVCFGDSLGDNLLITTLCKSLNERGQNNIWVKCNHAFLFEGNKDIRLVLPFQSLLSTTVLKLFWVKIVYPNYTVYSPEEDRDVIPNKHIVLKMADALNIRGPINNKPVINLSADEESKGCLLPNQIVIATSTTGAKVPMRTKEWFPERYQEIVDKLSNEYEFVQLGAKDDILLKNVTDMRGKTTVRESAAILKKSMLAITHVGFLMHLARAVDCRGVIIYGGREKPEQSGYECFENIYSRIECSPCWLHNRCNYDMRCMKVISAETVLKAVKSQLTLFQVQLPIDKLYND